VLFRAQLQVCHGASGAAFVEFHRAPRPNIRALARKLNRHASAELDADSRPETLGLDSARKLTLQVQVEAAASGRGSLWRGRLWCCEGASRAERHGGEDACSLQLRD